MLPTSCAVAQLSFPFAMITDNPPGFTSAATTCYLSHIPLIMDSGALWNLEAGASKCCNKLSNIIDYLLMKY